MANIKKAEKNTKPGRYMIIPRNQDTYDEKFCIANGKRLPFEVPVSLSQRDVETLEKQKEPFKADSTMTIYDVMDKYSVPQEQAVKILEAQSKHPELNESTIKWRAKYIVQSI